MGRAGGQDWRNSVARGPHMGGSEGGVVGRSCAPLCWREQCSCPLHGRISWAVGRTSWRSCPME